ncbi:hypothetical protein MN608_06723 [Microdochium nivale]|nr:hypothetical protein MN608_06723 [Microdochium nivale]
MDRQTQGAAGWAPPNADWGQIQRAAHELDMYVPLPPEALDLLPLQADDPFWLPGHIDPTPLCPQFWAEQYNPTLDIDYSVQPTAPLGYLEEPLLTSWGVQKLDGFLASNVSPGHGPASGMHSVGFLVPGLPEFNVPQAMLYHPGHFASQLPFTHQGYLTSPQHSSSFLHSTPSSQVIYSPQSSSPGPCPSEILQPFADLLYPLTSNEVNYPPTSEEVNYYAERAAQLGPCTREWTLPQTRRGRQKTGTAKQKTQTQRRVQANQERRRRGPFKDEESRQGTAQTRKDKGCMRCRMLRIRCNPDPTNRVGECLNCKKIQRPIMCKMPCLRWRITDSSLYREQDHPYQLFSKRWQNMDLVDIQTWASSEVKSIFVSQIFLDAPYEVLVREFTPVEGDMLQESWTSGSVVKSHRIPRYALANMTATATMLTNFIDNNILLYILGAVKDDELLLMTYRFAHQYMEDAKTDEERNLLRDCFRLWVGCRKTSNPHHIYGSEKLGATIVDDPQSMFHGVVPMPVIMIAQMECIMYTRVLRPMAKKVLSALNDLVTRNKPKYWLTIYLTTFILLHSCSMLTRRDWETARQYNLKEDFANPESINKQHLGANVILAHFHYLNKGVVPFSLSNDAAGRAQLAKAAELDQYYVQFVYDTSSLIADHGRCKLLCCPDARNKRQPTDQG